MDRKATVDVIIPAFNAARYLPVALESVASQSFSDWRIVLVDDGSTDNTPQVVAPFIAQLGEKLRYIRQDNRGLPAARNAAVRASDSEFLALLDADDVWLPCRLSESVCALRQHPEAGLAYGLVTHIDDDGVPQSTFLGNRRHAEGRIASQIYMKKVDLPCPTITFRRSCIEEVGLFDEAMRATEDRDLWLRIAQYHEVAFIPRVIAFYRNSASSMSRDTQRMIDAQKHFIRKHYGSPGCGIIPRQAAYARIYKQRADALKAQGKPRAALLSALQAAATYPLDIDNLRTAASIFAGWISSR